VFIVLAIGVPVGVYYKSSAYDNKVFIIRHAQSEANVFEAEHGPVAAHKAHALIDPPLTTKGVQEAIAQQKLTNTIDFTRVYVSPMRRAIQTAYYMFREHPNFDKIEFVLAPLVREVLLGADGIAQDI
jgi:broad specificity phosphatase PhoE